MTLDDALQYLETTARVSCPQITCEQAGEIAGLLRDLSDQHQVDIAEMVSWKIHAQVLHERDEALTKLREVERERDEATYTSEPPKPKKQKKVKQ